MSEQHKYVGGMIGRIGLLEQKIKRLNEKIEELALIIKKSKDIQMMFRNLQLCTDQNKLLDQQNAVIEQQDLELEILGRDSEQKPPLPSEYGATLRSLKKYPKSLPDCSQKDA